MTNDIDLLTVTAVLCASMGVYYLNYKHKRRKIWCKEWHLRRNTGKDMLNMLDQELLTEDPTAYMNFLRLNKVQFDKLFLLIESYILYMYNIYSC